MSRRPLALGNSIISCAVPAESGSPVPVAGWWTFGDPERGEELLARHGLGNAGHILAALGPGEPIVSSLGAFGRGCGLRVVLIDLARQYRHKLTLFGRRAGVHVADHVPRLCIGPHVIDLCRAVLILHRIGMRA